MKKYPVIIDPEFRALIPPMSVDERAQLKENIRQHGLLSPLLVWAGAGVTDGQPTEPHILIDGHHRFKILKELKEDPTSTNLPIEVRFDFVYLSDRETVKLWVLENQVGRRNLTKEQRIEMVARIVVLRQEQTEKTKRANLKKGDTPPEVGKMPTSGKKTVEDAAKKFDVPQKPLQAAVTAIKDNQPKPTTCDICSAPFESRGAMKAHRNKEHAEEMAARRNGKTSLRGPVVESQVPPAAGCSTQTTPLQDFENLKTAKIGDILLCWHGKRPCLFTVVRFTKSQVKVTEGVITDIASAQNYADGRDWFSRYGWTFNRWAVYNLKAFRIATDDDIKMVREYEAQNKPAEPSTPLQSLSETFYVIRRKSDGAFLNTGEVNRFDDDFTSATHYEDLMNDFSVFFAPNHLKKKESKLERDEWEWVKVEASYKLTAETAPEKAVAA